MSEARGTTSTPPNADSATKAPVVAAVGLTKIYKDFWMRDQVRAVDGLDLEIRPGEIFGLIGPNGSGKSTTIKIILGLLHKTAGRIAVFGKPPDSIAAKKRIGYLPEESYLYPYLSAEETLDFYGRLFGLPARVRRQRIEELLAMIGMDAVAHRPVGQFSKGMQRRVGIGQALINDPDFLILDEPTSGLDPIGIRQVKDLILQLGSRGKTILLSSHLLSEVEDVCDRIVILYGGKKRAEGTAEELLAQHDRTVIESEAISDETARAVRDVIHRREGKEVLAIHPARQSLESLFMDIVEKAQAAHIQTSGARAGGATAAFLRADAPEDASGEDLINRLVTAPASPPAPPASSEVPPPPRDEEPRADVLGDLMRTTDDQPEQKRPDDAPSGPSKSKPDVDRSVIDDLLNPDKGNGA